jgi:hypothetical protein
LTLAGNCPDFVVVNSVQAVEIVKSQLMDALEKHF